MLVGLLLACCLLLLGGGGVVAVPAAGVFVGQLGLLWLGMEHYLATPEPPPIWFGLPDT